METTQRLDQSKAAIGTLLSEKRLASRERKLRSLEGINGEHHKLKRGITKHLRHVGEEITRRYENIGGFGGGPTQFLEEFSMSASANLNSLKNIRDQLVHEMQHVSELEDGFHREQNQRRKLLQVNKTLKRHVEKITQAIKEMEVDRSDLESQIDKFKKFIVEKDDILITTLKREEIEIEKLTGAIGSAKFIDEKRKKAISDLFKISVRNNLEVNDIVSVYSEIVNSFEVLKPKRLSLGAASRMFDRKNSAAYLDKEVQLLLRRVQSYVKQIRRAKKKQHHEFRREVLENHKYIIAQNEMLLNLCIDDDKLNNARPSYISLNEVLNYCKSMGLSFDKLEAKSNLEAIIEQANAVLNDKFGYFEERKLVWRNVKRNIYDLNKDMDSLKMYLRTADFTEGIDLSYMKSYFERMNYQVDERVMNERKKLVEEKNREVKKIKKKLKLAYEKTALTQASSGEKEKVSVEKKIIQRLKKKLAEKVKEVEYLVKQRDGLQEEKKKMGTTIERLKDEIEFASGRKQAKSSKYLKKIEELNETIKDLNLDLDDLKQKLEFEKRRNADGAEELAEKDNMAKMELEKLEGVIKNLRAENKTLKEEGGGSGKKKGTSARKVKKRNMESQTKPLLDLLRSEKDFEGLLKKFGLEVERVDVEVQSLHVVTHEVATQKAGITGEEIRAELEKEFEQRIGEKDKELEQLKDEVSGKDLQLISMEEKLSEKEMTILQQKRKPRKRKEKEVKVKSSDLNPKVNFVYEQPVESEFFQRKVITLQRQIGRLQAKLKSGQKVDTSESMTQTEFSYTGKNVFQFLNKIKENKEKVKITKEKKILENIQKKNIDQLSGKEIKDILRFLHKRYKEKKSRHVKDDKFSFEKFNQMTKRPFFRKIDHETKEKLIAKEKQLLDIRREKRRTVQGRKALPSLGHPEHVEQVLKTKAKNSRFKIRKKLKKLMVLTQAAGNFAGSNDLFSQRKRAAPNLMMTSKNSSIDFSKTNPRKRMSVL